MKETGHHRLHGLSLLGAGFALSASLVAQAEPVIYIDNGLWGDCEGKYDPVERECSDGSATAYVYFASIARIAKPGTRFVIRGGDYKEVLHLKVSGTPAAPITFEAAPNETVTIRDVSSAEGEEDFGPIWLDNVSYNIIRGIKVTESIGFLRAINAHHNVLENNVFDTATLYPGMSKRGGLYFGWSNDNRIVNNVILRGTDSLALVHSDRNLIEGNRFEQSGHELLTMKCSQSNVVRRNSFKNPEQKLMAVFDCEIPTTNWVGNSNLRREEAITNRSHFNLIEHNEFADAASYYSTSGGNGIQYAGQDGIIRFNTFHSANVGLGMTRYETEAMFNTGNRVYHNVFHDNECGGISLMGAKSDDEKSIADNVYANNILWDNKGWAEEGNCGGVSPGQVLYRDSFIGHTFRGNAMGSPLGDAVIHNEFGLGEEIDGFASKGHFTDNIVGDPGMANPEEHNYRLKPDSPVIDRGVFLAKVTSASGQGTSFRVDDARWFYDGNGITGEAGDWIQIEGQGKPAQVTRIDRANHTIHVSSPVSWTAGAGVSMPWHGKAPDPGIRESGH